MDVLGRPPDYDTSHDTLVRVLISQLRKKLQDYFAGEGREEPLVIEIPRGNYLPVFRPRSHELDRAETLEEPLPLPLPPHRARSSWQIGGVVVAAMALLAAGWFASLAMHHPVRTASRPVVEAFWTQLFGNGVPTYLVLSDVGVMQFENIMGGWISLSEYEAHEFEQLSETRIPNPIQRMLARDIVNRVTTSVSDVDVARDFGVLAAERRLPLTLISARDMSSALVSSTNTILLGSWRADPWVGLFEDRLNFRSEYTETPSGLRFINRSPLPGEQTAYVAQWRRIGYCRVAFLPNPMHTGNVLLVSGSDVISSEAGGRFISSEESMTLLRRKLGLRPGAPFPHFEVLLRAQIVTNTVPSFEMVTYRPHAPAAQRP